MPEHPNEPLLEAILVNQDKNAKEVINTLELMLEHSDSNKLDPILEAQLLISEQGYKDVVQAIKDIPKTELPESKEVDFNETNKLLRELTDEVKKKEDYEVEIDSNLREKLKGEKGDKGENGKDGVNGKDGKDGKDGVDGLDGRDGKDGLQGPQGIPGKSLTQEDIDSIAKGLSKTKKENFLFANSGVNSVIAGSNITIDNSNPQHPIINSTGGGGSGSGDVVGPVSAVNNNFAAFDTTTGKLIKDSGSNASSFATSAQGTKADNAVVANGAITGATKTKITYDAKGLVTTGADATTVDIADSINKRYVTDANLVLISNTSNTNTGDETTATIKTKLGITTLSGSNTGDQTSIVGITGTIAQFNTAITDGDLATGGGTATGTNTGDNAVNTLYSGLASSKQDTLVSGTNIKTVNGNTLLGSGDVSITSAVSWGAITGTLSSQADLQTALDNKLDDTQFVGLSKITVGLTAPATPATGDLWVDTN